MLRRIAQYNDVLISCGCFGISIGPLGVLILFVPWLLLNFTESPSFSPLAWSPGGKQLAVGVYRENIPVGLYLVDTEDQHFQKLIDPLCDTVENCGGDLYIEWSADGQKIYFTLQTMISTLHYSISTDGSNLQLIETSQSTFSTNISEPTSIPASSCDEVDYTSTREMSPGGLLAQSSCSGEDCRICEVTHCTQKLMVCDTNTRKLLFKIDSTDYALARSDYSFWARPIGMLLSLLLALLGLGAVVLGLRDKPQPTKSIPDSDTR